MDHPYVGIRKNHTDEIKMDKKVHLAAMDFFVHFEKVGHFTPALVFDIVKPSFFPYPPCMATHCTHTTEKHITLPTHNTHHTLWRQRRQGQASTSTCWHCRRPTGVGGPRSEGGSNSGRRRGDRGIAAAVTAALAQLARLSTRGARAGSALAALYQRASTLHAVQDGAMGDQEGIEVEGGKATGRGGSQGGRRTGARLR
jgi:hypothetical protein